MVLVGALPARSEQTLPRGLFIGTRVHRIRLTAFAEPIAGHRLRMANGKLDAIPVIAPAAGLRVFSAVPNWQPSSIVLGNTAIFNDGQVTTRTLPVVGRQIAPFALELRVPDLEDPGAVARLIASVNALGDKFAYLFVVMSSNGVTRYFPVRLQL
jgi:hypothetical protein